MPHMRKEGSKPTAKTVGKRTRKRKVKVMPKRTKTKSKSKK